MTIPVSVHHVPVMSLDGVGAQCLNCAERFAVMSDLSGTNYAMLPIPAVPCPNNRKGRFN